MSDWLPDDVITSHILVIRFSAAAARNADCIFLHEYEDNYAYSIPNSRGLLRRQTSPDILPQCNLRIIPFATIVGSCHGLVCRRYIDADNVDHIYVLNPATQEHHLVPAPPPHWFFRLDDGYALCGGDGFGYDSGSKDYKYVMVRCTVNYSLRKAKSEVMSFGIRSKTWRWVTEVPSNFGPTVQYGGVLVGGALHWTFGWRDDKSITIVAYDLRTDQCREIPLPHHHDDEGWDRRWRLSDLGNCLCLYTHQYGYWQGMGHVWMMKEYGVKTSWSKLVSVSDSYWPDQISMVPLGLSMNGNEVVLHIGNGRLVWYDIDKDRPSQVMHLDLDDRRLVSEDLFDESTRMPFDAIACFASLVHPNGN